MNEDEKTKMMNLVRFWIFGIIVLVFGGLSAFFALVNQGVLSMPSGVLQPVIIIMIPIIIGAVALYIGYGQYLKRQ